ncbi:MAG TPA: serine hydrolase [Candidatus Eremiobacteraeota bacterium]|nr:serine hydrolase [Candidatus Eremiobacteraeota bacterium]
MKSKLFFIMLLSLAFLILSVATYASDYTKGPDSEKLKVILSDFETYAKTGMTDWQVPGMAIVIVKGDEIIYKKTFGIKEEGKTDPVTEETLFQIGSTSKAFTAALVAMMVDEGKVKWNDKVINYLPDFRMYDPWVTREFTITDLMAQRSGMPSYAADPLPFFGYDREYIIHNIRNIKPVGSFRSDFAYQNNLWLVAAKLVEKLSGKSWEENIEERIFNPLGMNNSSTDIKSYIEGKNVALIHTKKNGKVTALPMDWPFIHWTYIYGPAGGINSDITDMAKWLTMQLNNGTFQSKSIISKENMVFMHSPKTVTPPVVNEPFQYYCQGWVYRENTPCDIVWHNGGTSGFKTMIAIVPEAKIGIVVLSNLAGTELPEALAYRFFDMYFEKPARDWSGEYLAGEKKQEVPETLPVVPKNPSPPIELKNYTGTYSNDIYGEITVSQKDKGLIITIGPEKINLFLKHWDRDIFIFSIPGDTSESFVTFQTDYTSKVTGLIIDMLNNNGYGVFKRVKK